MAKKNTYVDLDLNQQELQNFSIEKLAAHPTGGDLFEGRAWQLTTDDHVYHYSNGLVRQVANIDDLNKFGALLGGHDASGGLIPTQGSGLNELGSPDLSIEAGDTWRITVAGTIVGLASGSDELDAGDVLIALIDTAATAADFMSIQLNLDDGVLDEVINYANEAAFPGTGSLGVIYLADDVNEAFLWDGAAYTPISLPNLQHAGTLGSFPGTGDVDILYIADDSQLVYFWDGVAYIPLSGVFSNFYAIDGALTGHRTVSGGNNNLTFTGILAYTISTATYLLTTVGDFTENIGGNKAVTVVGASTDTAAGKTITSTGAGNNVALATDTDGAMTVPTSANPDGDVTVALAGMVKYDSTDDHFRFYEGGAWRTFGSEVNIQHVTDFASLPVTGDPDIFYVTDDTDLVYFWDGAAYQLVGGGSLYANDGTLTGNRTVSMSTYRIIFDQTGGSGSSVTFSDTVGGVVINTGIVVATNVASTDSMGFDGLLGVYRQGGSVGEGKTILDFPVPATPSTNFTISLPADVNGTVALTTDTFYLGDGSIAGNRTVTGDENLLLFTNTNWKALTGDGAYFEAVADAIGIYGPGGVAFSGTQVGFNNVSGISLSEAATIQQQITFKDLGGTPFDGILRNADLSAARTWDLPDATGTVALTSDVTGIYSSDGTILTGRTATITDLLTFTAGNIELNAGQFYVAQVTDTVSANAVTVDFDEGNNSEIDLQPATGTVTLTLSNPEIGAWYTIKFIQGSGVHNVTWPATVKWPGGTAPTITATDNNIDLVRLYWDGEAYLSTFEQAFS